MEGTITRGEGRPSKRGEKNIKGPEVEIRREREREDKRNIWKQI